MIGCGVHLKSITASADFNSQLGIECITDVARRSGLRWFGQVENKDSDDWVATYGSFDVNGARNKGWGRKTWGKSVKDMVCIENGL